MQQLLNSGALVSRLRQGVALGMAGSGSTMLMQSSSKLLFQDSTDRYDKVMSWFISARDFPTCFYPSRFSLTRKYVWRKVTSLLMNLTSAGALPVSPVVRNRRQQRKKASLALFLRYLNWEPKARQFHLQSSIA
jgi:hypothetical protein